MSSPPYRTPAPLPPAAGPTRPDEGTRLGNLRSVHRPAPIGRLVWLGPVVLLVMVVAAAPSLRHLDELDAHALWMVVPFVVLFLALAVLAVDRRGRRLAVHEGGLVAERRGKRDVVVFEDVDELWFEQRWVRSWPITFAQITALRFVDHDGTRHQVPVEVEDSLGILRWVLRHCSDPLLPEARAAIAAGETITFGKIRLDRQGITVGKARSLWRDIRFVRSHLGSLSLFRRWPMIAWRTVTLDKIPHPTVFGRLVSELAPRVEHDYPLGISPE